MNNKGYSIVELLILIAVTGVIASVLIIKSSYAFKDNSSELYDQTEKLLLKAANNYALKNTDLFKDSSVITVKVDQLVKQNYFPTDNENGDVIDPRNKKAVLNNKEIKITKLENEKYKINVVTEQ